MFDFENILLIFQELAGCETERMNEVIPLVISANEKIESMIDKEKIQESDYQKCEYAAACLAFYSYACRESAKYKVSITESGKSEVNMNLLHKLPGAKILVDNAIERLYGIVKDDKFLFITVGGNYEQ